MKFPPFGYVRPASLLASCEALSEEGARPLAGGQSLLPLMALRMSRPSVLVDISRLEELRGIVLDRESESGPVLRIGAATTHAEVQESDLVKKELPILTEVASHIGHAAIRHLGTMGGSVAHCDPAAEWPATCIALGASAEITSREGVRRQLVEEMVEGPYQTGLGEGEVLSLLEFPLRPERCFGMSEVAIRRGDFALAGAVCVLEGSEASVTMFGVEGAPRRLALGELGRDRPALAREVAGRLESSLGEVLEDVHADGAFRRHLAGVAVSRALEQALTAGEPALL